MFKYESTENQARTAGDSSSARLHSESYDIAKPAAKPAGQISAVDKPNTDSNTLDFGSASDLYGKGATSAHPFSAAEINASGNNAASGLSQAEQNAKGPSKTEDVMQSATGGNSDQMTAQNAQSGVFTSIVGEETPGQVAKDIQTTQQAGGAAGVDQTALGDCWFQASVASLASMPEGQKQIQNMITQNKDGSYVVTFPGDPKHPQTVTQQDLNNPDLQDSATWAKVLEAANLKLNPKEAKSGGDPADAEHLLTGNKVNSQNLKGFFAQYDEQSNLESELKAGDVVTVDGAPDKNSPLVGDHVYSVLAATNNSVTVRNPWGNQQAGDKSMPAVGETKNGVTNIGGGELTMSSATFAKYFTTVDAAKS